MTPVTALAFIHAYITIRTNKKAKKVYSNIKHTEKETESPNKRKTEVTPRRDKHQKNKILTVRVVELYR